MPKRTDINSILIIGAGPIIIGQACEFDYSGTQACKALREEGYRVILVNSNPATIMTDPDLADATYIEPITPEIIEHIIKKEHPDALLPTMGGQTALNVALSLERSGILKKYNVEMIGANADTIDKAEDRALFRKAMQRIGLETPRSRLANATELKEEERKKDKNKQTSEQTSGKSCHERAFLVQEFKKKEEKERKQRYITHAMAIAALALDEIGLPAIIRPSFTLGGSGGGIAYNQKEFFEIVSLGLTASPTTEVLIEECILGWKEYEMEVVRDRADNCIIVCSIENIDPMGVHTGDSVTVCPALTLTDKEYQNMRNAALAVVREIGIETGGANVQFAVNPETGKLVVIEMNPRVSRSSALASKATGFPIARIAAKLAVGYTLDELENDITGGSIPASFEPSIDYIVTKIPRFAFEKFPEVKAILGASMQSVGEVMAIGRTFQESLQKAFRGLEAGLNGLDEISIADLHTGEDKNAIRDALGSPSPDRLRIIAQAMRMNLPKEEINSLCKIDPWFLDQIEGIVVMEKCIQKNGLPEDPENFRMLKAMGFSDARLAFLTGSKTNTVSQKRKMLEVRPIYKRIDSCAGEFAASTAYMYSTYEKPFFLTETADEVKVSSRKKIIILGSGPNRIGQGIEFDYCCVHASQALREAGYETIMINCNPETVSTDYDSSDRLYFEALTEEDVIEIVHSEQKSGTLHGIILQFGGQTPLKLAKILQEEKIPILGTPSEGIETAEDRNLFQKLLKRLDLKQPRNEIAYSIEEARKIAEDIKFPLVVRPSYVLGGQAMRIIENKEQLESWIINSLARLAHQEIKNDNSNPIQEINELLKSNPLLIDSCLIDAIEIDVDCLCDGEKVYIAGIMQHIEETGIHSGDSACSLPPHTLEEDQIKELKRQTSILALALKAGGLMNVQFAIQGKEIHVLEVNARASRTSPFVAKAIGRPLPAIAARVISGETLDKAFSHYGGMVDPMKLQHIAVKEAVFPFSRFLDIDTLLGPEMKSTGEVMGIDRSFALAFAKSQLAAGVELPQSGTLFVSVRDKDKEPILPIIQQLADLGFKILATSGTAAFLLKHSVQVEKINKVTEGRPHVEDAIRNGKIHIVFNTTNGEKAIADSRSLRRATLIHNIPYYTTLAGASAANKAIAAIRNHPFQFFPIQKYSI